MTERRTCGTCMRPLPEATPYRKPGEVQSEPEPAKPPKTDAARIVLEEEFREADLAAGAWLGGSGLAWGVTTFVGAIWAGTMNAGWGVAAACCLVFSVVCAAGYLRCRATIKAWRDQKRVKFGGLK